MKFFDNVKDTVKDDLQLTIPQGSKLSIAASCFSIYAFEVLKNELEKVSELCFLFTSPTFTAEKIQKDKREFCIPRLGRERNLYGSEFELKPRNELSQKAIAKECADWIRRKLSHPVHRLVAPISQNYLLLFNELWNDKTKMQDVTD